MPGFGPGRCTAPDFEEGVMPPALMVTCGVVRSVEGRCGATPPDARSTCAEMYISLRGPMDMGPVPCNVVVPEGIRDFTNLVMQ